MRRRAQHAGRADRHDRAGSGEPSTSTGSCGGDGGAAYVYVDPRSPIQWGYKDNVHHRRVQGSLTSGQDGVPGRNQMITDINLIAEQCGEDSRTWFPDLASSTTFMALAAAGEVGELCHLIKKVERGTHSPEDVAGQVVSEAMDAIIYLLNILDIEGQDVAALYDKIRENNARRFGVPSTTCPGGC